MQQDEGDYARHPFRRLPGPVRAGETQDSDNSCKTGGFCTFERSIAVLRYQAGEVAETALGKQKEPMLCVRCDY